MLNKYYSRESTQDLPRTETVNDEIPSTSADDGLSSTKYGFPAVTKVF